MDFVESPAEFFARRLNRACKGIGTDERTLIRIIVSRSEIDLNAIKNEYKRLFHRTLLDEVKVDFFPLASNMNLNNSFSRVKQAEISGVPYVH